MNAHAILSAQGWRGHGHSLHKTDDSIGLSKPLYLNRKNNTKGLGVSEHKVNDQWWLNAFDEQLKGLETNKKGEVKQTIKNSKLDTIKKGALAKYSVYSSFVSGGLLQGTLHLIDPSTTTSSESTTSNSDTDGARTTKSKDSKKTKETKEERQARKEARRIRKEARAARRAARQARRERRKAKKSAKSSGSDGSDAIDEEKRRRRAKKEEKRRRRAKKEEKRRKRKSKE